MESPGCKEIRFWKDGAMKKNIDGVLQSNLQTMDDDTGREKIKPTLNQSSWGINFGMMRDL
jgi:hypothetical protein